MVRLRIECVEPVVRSKTDLEFTAGALNLPVDAFKCVAPTKVD
jgi:hypothetical protein